MRTIEQIAENPQAGDVVMVPIRIEVEEVGEKSGVWIKSQPWIYSASEWAELCRSAKLPGDWDE